MLRIPPFACVSAVPCNLIFYGSPPTLVPHVHTPLALSADLPCRSILHFVRAVAFLTVPHHQMLHICQTQLFFPVDVGWIGWESDLAAISHCSILHALPFPLLPSTYSPSLTLFHHQVSFLALVHHQIVNACDLALSEASYFPPSALSGVILRHQAPLLVANREAIPATIPLTIVHHQIFH